MSKIVREKGPATAACVIGVTGYSGAGKTTLIEKALPELKKWGLSVGVLKHAHHALETGDEGKDTARFYGAGAAFVFAHDFRQGFARFPCTDFDLTEALRRFPRGLDVILVEGYKGADIRAIRIESGISGEPPAGVPGDSVVIFREARDALERFLDFVMSETRDFHSRRRVRAGLLIGGKSTRMGMPKGLLEIDGLALTRRSLDTLGEVASSAVLLGTGSLPRDMTDADCLPDVPCVEGPLGGILSAFRWDPDSVWIISAVDMPLMVKDAWRWLLSQRRPGVWAVMPRMGGGNRAEATGACYEPMIFDYVDALAAKGVRTLQAIAEHPRVMTPKIPGELARAWKNVNTPEEWRRIARER